MKHILHAVLALALTGCGGGAPAGSPDGALDGSPDGSRDGGAGPPAPRLIAPASLGAVTQQRPTLRWVLGEGTSAPAVELCRDRGCTQPLAIATQIAADGTSAVPVEPLPPGWVYWRVRASRGAEVATSRTWPFWVGRASASAPVDTSGRPVLDVNGDGHPDFLVGAPDVNAAHLYLGSADASASAWNGEEPAARIDLLAFASVNSGFAASVASVGDVNGDGYGDFVVGCGGCTGGGVVYLYFGSAAPRADDWNGLAPVHRVALAAQGASFGRIVAAAGDVDGDGYADLLVAGFHVESYGFDGGAWLYLGSATATADTWNASSSALRVELEAPAPQSFDRFAFALAGIGDVNRDGYADFAISQLDVSAAHVYLGAPVPRDAGWNDDGPARIALHPSSGTRSFGVSVAGAGDVNGDGHADFLVGDAGIAGNGLGEVHLYLGAAAVSADAWNQPASPLRVELTSPGGANTGYGDVLAGAGDVNGDGYGDFLAGAGDAGAVHLYLGGATADAAAWNSAGTRRVDLASPTGTRTRFGGAVAGAGDVDGDGYGDFVVGADAVFDHAATGAAHLYLGSAAMTAGAATATRRDLQSPDGDGAHFGRSVARLTAPPDRSPIRSCGAT